MTHCHWWLLKIRKDDWRCCLCANLLGMTMLSEYRCLFIANGAILIIYPFPTCKFKSFAKCLTSWFHLSQVVAGFVCVLFVWVGSACSIKLSFRLFVHCISPLFVFIARIELFRQVSTTSTLSDLVPPWFLQSSSFSRVCWGRFYHAIVWQAFCLIRVLSTLLSEFLRFSYRV